MLVTLIANINHTASDERGELGSETFEPRGGGPLTRIAYRGADSVDISLGVHDHQSQGATLVERGLVTPSVENAARVSVP